MENKNHALRYRTAIRAVVIAAALGSVSLTASALAPSKGYNVAVTPDGKNFKLKYSSDGTPTATTANGSSGVTVTAPANVQLGPIKAAAVVVGGIITGASVGGAVGAAIGGLGALVVATLPGFQQLFDRAGVRIKQDGTAERTLVCTVAPCYLYDDQYGGTHSTATGACSGYAAGASLPDTPHTMARVEGDTCFISYKYQNLPYEYSVSLSYQPATPSTNPQYLPATVADVVQSITANAPTTAEVQALLDASYPPEVAPLNATGPARVFMGNTVELFSPSEKRTIEEWKNLDYTTPGLVKVRTEKKTTVTSSATTTTTQTTNSDGTTSSAVTTKPATSKVETTFDDNEKAKEVDDPCRSNPLRVGCLDVDTPELEVPRETREIDFQEENVLGSGSCPANLTTHIALLGKTVTVWDWTKTCEMALPLRALVLALATFAALLIVMPGKVET